MKPVLISTESGENLSKEDFISKILKVCREHHEAKRALAFAFLVYDTEDASIIKVLKDNIYWEALNKVAGRFLTVFYVESSHPVALKPSDSSESRASHSEQHFGYMTAVDLRGLGADRVKETVLGSFGLSSDLKTPFVLFFQTDGELVLDHFAVTLHSDKIEESFLELKSHIGSAVSSVKEVQEKNFNNHQPIFELIKNEVKKGVRVKFFTKKVLPGVSTGTIVSLFKYLSSL